jgi:hypothetical protein
VRFIRQHSRAGAVYVHCKIGYSRTAAVVASYLLATDRARTPAGAIARLRRVRPSIVVRPEAAAAIAQFEASLGAPCAGHEPPESLPHALVCTVMAVIARFICGVPQWNGCTPGIRPRIYYANHTSHLDCVVLWASLPADVRVRTRPVAGRDYWNRTRLRRFVARWLFRAVLVDRPQHHYADRNATVGAARRSVERAARALAALARKSRHSRAASITCAACGRTSSWCRCS